MFCPEHATVEYNDIEISTDALVSNRKFPIFQEHDNFCPLDHIFLEIREIIQIEI